jgi:hypothetical protein
MAHVSGDLQGWLPVRAWQSEGQWRLDWCWFGETRLTRPFFREDVEQALRLPFNLAFRRDTPLEALPETIAADGAVAPSAFIFHASRCGSTLMAQMLAALPRYIVLSEPAPLDSLLRAHRVDAAIAERQPELLAALLSAYGQRQQGGERQMVVKLDAWNIFEAPLLLELYPQTPRLFLYRDPLEIVVSQLRIPGMHRVPGMLGPSALDSDEFAQTLSPPEYTSLIIGRILESGLELCQRLGGVPVNYSELPGALWGRLGHLFGLTQADRPALGEAAAFNAKRPGFDFVSDSQEKRDEADAAVRAAVARWAQAPYEALERLRLEGRR